MPKFVMLAVETFQPIDIYVGNDDKLYFEQTISQKFSGGLKLWKIKFVE